MAREVEAARLAKTIKAEAGDSLERAAMLAAAEVRGRPAHETPNNPNLFLSFEKHVFQESIARLYLPKSHRKNVCSLVHLL